MTIRPTIGICITSLGASNDDLKKLQDLIADNSRLKDLKIFGDICATDAFDSRPASERIASLEAASQACDIVVAWNGGYNSIELLPGISNANINPAATFVGYSDNTILANALPATGKAKGYMGPMARNWVLNPEYIDLWLDALFALYKNDSSALTKIYNQQGCKILRPGVMRGKIWGGNNYTFDLLQGTAFAPNFNEPFILLLEGEDFITDKKRIWSDFVRNLDSVMLQPGARDNLQGLLIAKFPTSANVDENLIAQSLNEREYLKDRPIAINFPRGYNQPSLYLPIGQQISLALKGSSTVDFQL